MKLSAKAFAPAVALVALPVHAQEVKADEKGLTLEAGPLQLNLGGRLHLDASVFDEPDVPRTGTTSGDVRRARIELSGRVAKVLRFRVDREFAGAKGWRNVWASIEPVSNLEIKGGNMIVPFSLEDLQSSNVSPFAERSMASALTGGFGFGGAVFTGGRNWSASVGYFTDALANDEGRTTERGKGVLGRVTFAPVRTRDTLLHLGFGGERRSFSATERVRFTADPGSVFAPNVISSGTLGSLDTLTAWNGEAAVSFGPVLLQGQAIALKLHRSLFDDRSFNGQTVSVGWIVTGQRHEYSGSSGVFGGPDRRKGEGAFEIAARYSRLDLVDGTFDRGIGRALSASAIWTISTNLRVLATYTDNRVRFPNGGLPAKNRVGVLRAQLSF
ncbi:OprO/OprP family phosphate-selective porin [Novosphingobium sp. B1]|uniref:OprO/OprP family phosphate-selective porin n=1 Tax=Novosphingobium sp. B1 TaxID=1938756 RepID=UPI0009D8A5CA|nr:porin [Novosphingobium sp. B1]SMD08492.1 Phosphate-selective porin [Novosphingobium sp. B1]